jgi:hypothetical protein
VRWAPGADGRCAFYLVASTPSGGVYSRALGPWTLEISKLDVNARVRPGHFGVFPKIEAIVDLGGRGDLVVLSVGEGAANLGLSFLGVAHGRLHVVRVGGAKSVWPGGSVMDMSGLACSRGGPLRELGIGNVATRKHPNRWDFSSVTYRERGSRFVAVAHRSLNGSRAKVFAAAKQARMPNDPLKGCSLARQPGNWGSS